VTPNSQKEREDSTELRLSEMRAYRLHKMRYLCKFQVQLCAIASQNKLNREALNYSQHAALMAQTLIAEAQFICKEHLRKLSAMQKGKEEEK
jgi:hypothetical protein